MAITASTTHVSGVHQVSLDHLFTQPVASLRVTHLKAGPRHVLAVLQYTTYLGEAKRQMLIGWGAGRNGQLEARNPEATTSEKPQANGPRRVPLPMRITTWVEPVTVMDMSIGYQHAIVLLSDGSIFQVGSNSKSQFPSWSGYKNHSYERVLCSWNNSFIALRGSNSLLLRSYGRNSHGQLGRLEEEADEVTEFPPSFKISHIVCGSEHCLVMGTEQESDRGELWAWGWNEHGNLALSHNEDVLVPTRIPLPREEHRAGKDEDNTICGIWAGCGTSWVATEALNPDDFHP